MVLFPLPCILLILSATTIASAANTAKPGCQQKCGNLTVPYPFGIGAGGCSLSSWYQINCNSSYHPPKPFLASTKIEILDISQTHLRIRNQVAARCYNSDGVMRFDYVVSMDLLNSPFVFSDTLNKFTAMGCDDVATISGTGVDTYVGACVTLCTKKEDIQGGSCSGIGCCQTSIPKGLKAYSTNRTALTNFERPSDVIIFDPCSYNFLAEVNSFTFQGLADLADPKFMNRTEESVPVVLDWNVGNGSSCSQAQHSSSTSYECQQNTNCTDSNLGSGTDGYTCSCLPGYEGNPYLTPGCTDVDECANAANNLCSRICSNVPGSYRCSCPGGHHGDGRKDGSGCSADNMQVGAKFALGLGAGVGFVIFLFGCYWLFHFVQQMREKRKRAKNFSQNGGLLLKQGGETDDTVEKTKIFTSPELEKATDNFNHSRILGQGGQGTVYKGMLADGRIVAIKKSKKVDDTQSQQFVNEVVILSHINHKNVVKLLGCCLETQVPLLVYEYVPNGTLWQFIHNSNEDFHITWEMRLQIATEAAGALAYLHSSLSAPIYHRDIKSSNFLLDEKYKVKISDFGISRSIDVDQTHLTTCVKGTFGYLDPEYFHSYQFTDKSDVYSFGVVLVELLTRKKPIGPMNEDCRGLAVEFLMTMENRRLFEMLDPHVLESGKDEEVRAVAELARRCLNISGKRRPTMKEVATLLEGVRSLSSSSAEVSTQESLFWEMESATAAEIRDGLFQDGTSSGNTSSFFTHGETSYILR